MIPDKIYINGFSAFATEPVKNGIEYIRKDALMEWLENKIKIPDVSFINGLTYLAYQDVIEHINEM
jgi:hypothetical protein